ncbi:MAG: hypothetical protein JNG90_12140, partial [Planctomycetaceae bacterium]|nr:hypothetical protein [Planctomycetaceae bacterium]
MRHGRFSRVWTLLAVVALVGIARQASAQQLAGVVVDTDGVLRMSFPDPT